MYWSCLVHWSTEPISAAAPRRLPAVVPEVLVFQKSAASSHDSAFQKTKSYSDYFFKT